MPFAIKVNKYNGQQYYKVPVIVRLNDSTLCATVAEYQHEVLARNAADAANYVRDLYSDRPETEIFAYGPKGGKVYRYIGWESSIAAQMFAGAGNVPRNLNLQLEG